jgi:hypothetical protein
MDNGGRTEEDGMEDKAASFLPDQNTLSSMPTSASSRT